MPEPLERLPVQRPELSQIVVYTTEKNECQKEEAKLSDPSLTPVARYQILRGIVGRELRWAIGSLRRREPKFQSDEVESEKHRQWAEHKGKMETVQMNLAEGKGSIKVHVPGFSPYIDRELGECYNLRVSRGVEASRFTALQLAGGSREVLRRMDEDECQVASTFLEAALVEIHLALDWLDEWTYNTSFSYVRPAFGNDEDEAAKRRALELVSASSGAMDAEVVARALPPGRGGAAPAVDGFDPEETEGNE